MKHLFLYFCLFACAMVMAAGGAHWYVCRKCSVKVVKDGKPSVFNCAAKGHHDWNDMGKAGDEPWQCSKCGLQLYMGKGVRPSVFNCRAGGHHNWNKM